MAAPVKRKSTSTIVNMATASKRANGHWSSGLAASMNDPDLLVEEDDTTVTIKDKYPKAKFHFLVLPKESISTLNKLQKTHVPLLKHMDERGRRVALMMQAKSSMPFRFGYHAVPSMRCHICKKAISTMPSLKDHIRSHVPALQIK